MQVACIAAADHRVLTTGATAHIEILAVAMSSRYVDGPSKETSKAALLRKVKQGGAIPPSKRQAILSRDVSRVSIHCTYLEYIFFIACI